MHTFLLIMIVHAILIGNCFLIGGWATLINADDGEQAAFQRDCEEAGKKGWIETLMCLGRYRNRIESIQRITTNWAERPDARKFVYAGVGFLAFAALLGIPLSAYK